MIKKFKNLLISCFVLSLVIASAITMTAFAKIEKADAAAANSYTVSKSNVDLSINLADLPEGAEIDYEASKALNAALSNNNTGTWEDGIGGAGPEFHFPLWMLSFAVIPGLLLILRIFIGIRSENLRRKTVVDMTNEKLKYYGLSKADDSVFKNKISLFSISEVRARIKQNRENKKEEKIRLQNRQNYNFNPED